MTERILHWYVLTEAWRDAALNQIWRIEKELTGVSMHLVFAPMPLHV